VSVGICSLVHAHCLCAFVQYMGIVLFYINVLKKSYEMNLSLYKIHLKYLMDNIFTVQSQINTKYHPETSKRRIF
jgi:hypothetical protein